MSYLCGYGFSTVGVDLVMLWFSVGGLREWAVHHCDLWAVCWAWHCCYCSIVVLLLWFRLLLWKPFVVNRVGDCYCWRVDCWLVFDCDYLMDWWFIVLFSDLIPWVICSDFPCLVGIVGLPSEVLNCLGGGLLFPGVVVVSSLPCCYCCVDLLWFIIVRCDSQLGCWFVVDWGVWYWCITLLVFDYVEWLYWLRLCSLFWWCCCCGPLCWPDLVCLRWVCWLFVVICSLIYSCGWLLLLVVYVLWFTVDGLFVRWSVVWFVVVDCYWVLLLFPLLCYCMIDWHWLLLFLWLIVDGLLLPLLLLLFRYCCCSVVVGCCCYWFVGVCYCDLFDGVDLGVDFDLIVRFDWCWLTLLDRWFVDCFGSLLRSLFVVRWWPWTTVHCYLITFPDVVGILFISSIWTVAVLVFCWIGLRLVLDLLLGCWFYGFLRWFIPAVVVVRCGYDLLLRFIWRLPFGFRFELLFRLIVDATLFTRW